jgi:hypothetical protein
MTGQKTTHSRQACHAEAATGNGPDGRLHGELTGSPCLIDRWCFRPVWADRRREDQATGRGDICCPADDANHPPAGRRRPFIRREGTAHHGSRIRIPDTTLCVPNTVSLIHPRFAAACRQQGRRGLGHRVGSRRGEQAPLWLQGVAPRASVLIVASPAAFRPVRRDLRPGDARRCPWCRDLSAEAVRGRHSLRGRPSPPVLGGAFQGCDNPPNRAPGGHTSAPANCCARRPSPLAYVRCGMEMGAGPE